MDRVNSSDHVSNRLELVQKLYDFVHLIKDIYLLPSLLGAKLLKLTRTDMCFGYGRIDSDDIRG